MATELMSSRRVGDTLGWVSLGLGVAALMAPRAIGRATGLGGNHTTLLRMVGLAVATIAAADLTVSLRARERRGEIVSAKSEPYVEQSITVNKSPQECYQFWRNIENHPKFSSVVQSATEIDDRRSHWVMKGPGGMKLEWDAELTADLPGEQLAWRSLESSQGVHHAGTVRFEKATGGRGTIVRVSMHYRPPFGGASVGFAKALGRDPNAQVREDLRRFKSYLETGEIASTRGQPSGRRSGFRGLTPEGRRSRERFHSRRRARDCDRSLPRTPAQGA